VKRETPAAERSESVAASGERVARSAEAAIGESQENEKPEFYDKRISFGHENMPKGNTEKITLQ
jgi:hypothetical protein